MATKVYFNGKQRVLPGVYSTITSGDNTATRNLDYGTALLIDTGVYGAGFCGGSGIGGQLKSGKDAIYEFTDLESFRAFVKGGMYWKAAEALFTPDPYNSDATGISKLLFVRNAETTAAAIKITSGETAKAIFKTIDEGLWANGEKTSAGNLKKGYAATIVAGEEDNSKFIVKFWRGTFTGDYTDPVTGDVISYAEISADAAEPELLCQSVEISTIGELLTWAKTSSDFGVYFYVDSTSVDGSISDTLSATEDYILSSGATETYRETLTDLLSEITDVEYNIAFLDRVGSDCTGAMVKALIAHRNTAAKFDKFVYVGAYNKKSEYASSLKAAAEFNNAYVVCMHGGIGTVSDAASTGIRWWGVFYNLCQLIGRVSGKAPYIPVTNKTIGGDYLQHIPTEKEQEKALKAGLVVVYPNPYLRRFVVLQGITTLQDNENLFNKKGQSFSIQFMRIIAQLNKECVVNAELDLLADEDGVNINTLSKGSLENWTINFLQSRVATDSQDNLINRFQNVIATRIDDYYKVSYEVVLNNEITKVFFTGFLLRK